MKYTIEVSRQDLDQIMVKDLQDAFRYNLDSEDKEELLDAIEVVLSYYMSPSEYKEWFKTRGRE
jgi:hypothetical protein